ncbi:MAG: ABC transporter substrate-binding protein [Lautropia sp.]
MRKVIFAAGLVAAVGVPVSGFAQGTKGTVEIGCISPLSGAAAPIGNNLTAGAKFAVSRRPVINGWNIRLNIQDTVGDPANALQKAQAFDGNRAVVAITCVGYSQEAAAVAGALKTGRLAIPYIDGNNVGDNITGQLCSKWTFRTQPSIAMLIKAQADYLKRNPTVGQKGWYIIGSDSAYGNGMVKAFAQTGGKVLGSNLAALDTTDWVPIINKALSSGADAIWLPVNFGTPLSQFLNQANRLGLLKSTKVFLPVGLSFLDAIQNLGPDGVGLTSAGFQMDLTLPAARELVAAYHKATGEAPSQQTLQQIVATDIILDAIAAAEKPTREEIQKKLATMEFKNFTGTVKFRQPDQQAIVNLYEGTIRKLETPQFGVNYSWIAEHTYSSGDVLPNPKDSGCNL